MNITNFDWGNSSRWYIENIGNENFNMKIYEKFFEVEENDIIFDIGASIGIFTYSILDKNPKHVFCFEPGYEQFKTLVKNTRHANVTCINKGIGSVDGKLNSFNVYGETENSINYCITFKKIIQNFNLSVIDFLKIDCEGGEYDIFNEENLYFIKNNVKKIAGEWHLNTPETKEKFKHFRNTILVKFDNYHVLSVDGVDIKWSLFNEDFIDYYTEILIYIDNR